MDPTSLIAMQAEAAAVDPEVLDCLNSRMAWLNTSRYDQLPPSSDPLVWLLMAGRGSGKTRAGAEDIAWEAVSNSIRVGVGAPTSNDVRKTCFEGESGLLAVIPESMVQKYSRASLEIWLKNGSYIVGYSSEEPERLRGPQHHLFWGDELASWKYPEDMWDMMMFGLRLGDRPKVIATTTPKPIKLIKELVADADCVVTTASTFDNKDHLPEKILRRFRDKYEGTRLGDQELYAKILGDNPYALWQSHMIENYRIAKMPELERVVVAVDPPTTSGDKSDECGIVTAGKLAGPDPARYAVFDDTSVQGLRPDKWAEEVVATFTKHRADCVVAESNQGGEMVQSVINSVDPSVPVRLVHATRGKVLRAEPVSALYEQGRVHHVGTMGMLESQMCEFTTDFNKRQMGYSPDRVDALVHAIAELMGAGGDSVRVRSL